MRRGILLASLVALTTPGLAAGSASAAVFCVNKSPCFGGLGVNQTTIQAALDAAAVNNVEDTILVDDNGGTPYEETLSYTDSETVHIKGDGVGATIIQGPATFSNAVTLLNPSSTIEDLTIRAPDVSNGSALRWDGTASNIRAEHLGSTATATLGMVAQGNAVLEDSTVDVNGSQAMQLQSTTGAVVRDSTIVGDVSGIGAPNGQHLTLSRSTVTTSRSPVSISGPASTLNVDNSVLRRTGTMFGDGAILILSGPAVVVRHATMIGAGVGGGVYADASTAANTVTIFDSIIDNFEFALRCFGTGANTTTLGISYSNWTDPVELDDPECIDTLGAGNNNITDPVYASTSLLFPSFRLKAPSPLIDAAEPADPLVEDLAGAPRPVDGDGVGGARSDMGAYEYQRQAPIAVISAPATATVGSAVDFTAKGSSDPDPGDTLTYVWDFGDGGMATGLNAQHTYAAGGAYSVKVTATDPTGLSATATAEVTVPAVGGGGGGGGGGGQDESTVPPKLSKLRAVPKRVARGKAKPKLVPGGKRGILFELSTPAKVTLTLERCKGRSGCTKRAKVGSKSFDAPAGSSAIVFKGKLSGKLLAAGRYLATLKVAAGPSKSTPLTLLP